MNRRAVASLLREANRLLKRRYRTPNLRNKRNPVSELSFIILSARTRGRHHEAIYRKLRRHFRNWEAVRDARPQEIESVIHDAGLSRIKAQQIKTLLQQISADFGSLSTTRFRRM